MHVYGEYVFHQFLRQANLHVVKLPIIFPAIISKILISQKLDIFNSEDIVRVSVIPLTFSYPLFVGTCVPYIYIPNIHFDLTNEDELPELPPMFVAAEALFCWN